MNSSAFVVSSRFEGLSMAMLEAVACGLPMVSFACPCGPRDVVTDGVDGLLVENGRTDLLAEKLIYLLEHPDERRRMGEAARQNAARFRMENLAEEWQRLFDSL